MSANQIASGTEEAAVNEFGYRQELKRVLCLFAVFSVAFSIISITTGIFLNLGFAITISDRPASGCARLPRSARRWSRLSSPNWRPGSHWRGPTISGRRA